MIFAALSGLKKGPSPGKLELKVPLNVICGEVLGDIPRMGALSRKRRTLMAVPDI